ncbi:MAG: flagellar M-ring protein FliF C-terminal domain-containing protein, partial [Candidatus Xenobia bacterium]
MGNAKPATAEVLLVLRPGQEPTRQQVDAVVAMVSYSVPGMQPENVKVITDQGKVLNDRPSNSTQTGDAGGSPVPEEEVALKQAIESQLKDKVIPNLDTILGHDKYTLNVDAQIDFSQKKIERTTLGPEVKTDETHKDENFNNTPKDSKDAKKGPSGEVAGPDMGSTVNNAPPGNKTAYTKSDFHIKYDHNKVQETVLVPAGAVQRLTAQLTIDANLTQKQKDDWSNYLKASLGMDESRGDTAFVMDYAFAHAPSATGLMKELEDYHNKHPYSDPAGLPTGSVAMILGGTVLVLLTLIAVFLIKQNKVQIDKSSLILATGPSANATEITDLLNEKNGKSSATTQTTMVNNKAELEKLAKEKPTRVAELLKSTWLSEKEK